MNIDPKIFTQWADEWDSTGRITYEKYITQKAAAYGAQQERERLMAGSGEPLFLVATGEHCDAKETYTRHEVSPPSLCDFEGPLYTADQLAAARLRGGQVNQRLMEALKEIANTSLGASFEMQSIARAAIASAEGISHE